MCELWKNGLLDLDAVWDGEWGRSRDGCIVLGWRSSKGKGQFWGKCAASHCNQWCLCGIVFFAVRCGDAALPNYFGFSC